MSSLEQRQRAAELIEQAGALLATATNENRDLTAKEAAEFDRIHGEAEALNRDLGGTYLTRREAQEQAEARLARPMPTIAGGKTGPVDADGFDFQPRHSYNPGGRVTSRSLFGPATGDPRGGFEDIREFLGSVVSGRADRRLTDLEQRQMLAGVPASGGFMIPVEFSREVLDAALESSVVVPRARVYNMTSPALNIPGFDGSDHTSSLFGGLTGQWLAEGAAATPSTAQLRQIGLNANKLAIYTDMSREFILGSTGGALAPPEAITEALGKAVAFFWDEALLATGSGAGQPLSVLNSPSIIAVPAEAGQVAGTIVYENICHMWARLHAPSASRAVWVAHPSTLPQLFTMSLAVGTAGTAVFVPNSGAAAAPYSTLMGRPVIISEKLPALGQQGDIILVDFSQYAVGIHQSLTLDISNAPGWLTDLVSLRVVTLGDGQATWNAAITPRNGAATLSWAVALAARP